MTRTAKRCYRCHEKPAAYTAHLDHDCTPTVWLCIDCAAWERDWDSIVWIRTYRAAVDA